MVASGPKQTNSHKHAVKRTIYKIESQYAVHTNISTNLRVAVFLYTVVSIFTVILYALSFSRRIIDDELDAS